MAHIKKEKVKVKKEKLLSVDEMKDLEKGRALEEMVKNSTGWKIVSEWLESLARHSWVDPREARSEKDWMWRELNAYHAANNAKELLEAINQIIGQSDYLDKVRTGQIDRKRKMRI